MANAGGNGHGDAIGLSLEEILSASDITTERVDVPEWGGVVYVKMMSGAERDAFEQSCIDIKQRGRSTTTMPKLDNYRARFLSKVLCNADGVLLCKTPDDVAKLGGKSAAALERVFEAGRRLNGFSQSDVDELAGNSDGDPSADSISV